MNKTKIIVFVENENQRIFLQIIFPSLRWKFEFGNTSDPLFSFLNAEKRDKNIINIFTDGSIYVLPGPNEICRVEEMSQSIITLLHSISIVFRVPIG